MTTRKLILSNGTVIRSSFSMRVKDRDIIEIDMRNAPANDPLAWARELIENYDADVQGAPWYTIERFGRGCGVYKNFKTGLGNGSMRKWGRWYDSIEEALDNYPSAKVVDRAPPKGKE